MRSRRLPRAADSLLVAVGRVVGLVVDHLAAGDHLDFRLADLDVLVAEPPVEIAHRLEVLLDGGGVVHVALADAGDQVRLLGLLHLAAQLRGREDLVALEGDLTDLDLVALVDGDDHALLGIGYPLDVDVHHREAVAALGVERLDRLLQPHQLAAVERQAFVDLDALLVGSVGDVGALDLVETLVVDRTQQGTLDDLDHELHAVAHRLGADRDVVDHRPVPELADRVVQPLRVVALPYLETEVVVHAVFGQRLETPVLDRRDLAAGQLLREGSGRRRRGKRVERDGNERQRRLSSSHEVDASTVRRSHRCTTPQSGKGVVRGGGVSRAHRSVSRRARSRTQPSSSSGAAEGGLGANADQAVAFDID